MFAKEAKLKLRVLKTLLHYDPLTGIFVWKKAESNRVKIGAEAGTVDGPYRLIRIRGSTYQAHRLAWFYVHGKWPNQKIDHKDSNGYHNWIDNLREATNSQNAVNNNRRHGMYGKGVVKWGKRFAARIKFNKIETFLGAFNTPREARAAYIKASKELHGEFSTFK